MCWGVRGGKERCVGSGEVWESVWDEWGGVWESVWGEEVCWRVGKGCGERNGGGVGKCVRMWGPNTLPHISSLTSPFPTSPLISPTPQHTSLHLPLTPLPTSPLPHPTVPHPSPLQSVAKLPCDEVSVAKLPCGKVTGNLKHLAFYLFIFNCIFILLSRESDQCAIPAHLGVASHLSTTPRWGNLTKCLPQRHK